MNRVQFDEDRLDFDGDQLIYDGVPFTGVSFEEYPGGRLKNETPYRDGFRDGLCREWYPHGQLKSEWFSVRGRAKGKSTKWHENGMIKSIGKHGHGLELRYEEWTAQSELIVSRQIDRNSQLYQAAVALDLKFRRMNASNC